MSKLYEISNAYQSVMHRIEEQDGELTSEIMTELHLIEAAMEDKLLAMARFIKNLEAEHMAVAEERKAMQLREKRLDNKISNIKKYIANTMTETGLDKVQCAQFKISLRTNPARLNLFDESIIPYTYKKVIYDWDKAKIKDDLKAGQDVPGAKLENGKSIQFT